MRKLPIQILVLVCLGWYTHLTLRAEQSTVTLDRTNVTVTVGADCIQSYNNGAYSPCTITGNNPITVTFTHQDSGAFCSKVHAASILVEPVPRTDGSFDPNSNDGETGWENPWAALYNFDGSLTGGGAMIQHAIDVPFREPWIPVASDYWTDALPAPTVKNPGGLCNVNPTDVSPYPSSFSPLILFNPKGDPFQHSPHTITPGKFCYDLAASGVGWGKSYTKTYVVAVMWDDDPGDNWQSRTGTPGGYSPGWGTATTGYAQYTMTIQCPASPTSAMTMTPSSLNVTVGSDNLVLGNVSIAADEKWTDLTGIANCAVWPSINYWAGALVPFQTAGTPIHNGTTKKLASWQPPPPGSALSPTECSWDRMISAKVVDDAQIASICSPANYGKTLNYMVPVQLELVNTKSEGRQIPVAITCTGKPTVGGPGSMRVTPAEMNINVAADGTVTGNQAIAATEIWQNDPAGTLFGLDGQTYTGVGLGGDCAQWQQMDLWSSRQFGSVIEVNGQPGFFVAGEWTPDPGVTYNPYACSWMRTVKGKIADDSEFTSLCHGPRPQLQTTKLTRTAEIALGSLHQTSDVTFNLSCALPTFSSTVPPSGLTNSVPTLASPTLMAAFANSTISVNGVTRLTFTIQNSTNTQMSAIGLTADLPSGLVVALPNGVTNTCGGKATATSWMTSLGIVGGSLAPHAACAVSLNVTATTSGEKNASAVMNYSGGTPLTSSSTILTVQPGTPKAPAPTPPPKAPEPTPPPQNSVTTAAIVPARGADVIHGSLVAGLDQRLGSGDLGVPQQQAALALANIIRTILLRDAAVSSPEGYSVRVHRAFGSRAEWGNIDSGLLFFAGAYGTFFSAEAKPSPTHFGHPEFGIYANTVLQCPLTEFSPPNGSDERWLIDGHLPVLQGGRRTGEFRGYSIYDGQCIIMTHRQERPFIPLTREQFVHLQIETLQKRIAKLRSQYSGQGLDTTVREALESISKEVNDAVTQLSQNLASMDTDSRRAPAAVRLGYAQADLVDIDDKDAVPLSIPSPDFFDRSLPSTTVQAIEVYMPFLQSGERAAGLPAGLPDDWRPAAEKIRDQLDWPALAALLK